MADGAVGSRPTTKFAMLGSKEAKHALVFLHGWKQGGSDMRNSLRSTLGGPLRDTVVYCLTASATVDGAGEQPDAGAPSSVPTSTEW